MVAIIIILILFFGFIAPAFVLSSVIYSAVLVRTNPAKWSREISMPEDRELSLIYADGREWVKDKKEFMTEVSIENDGLKLVGEYYDFGAKNAVIIIPGRMEGLRYSYHFAVPYHKAGYNVLVIDNRSHGLSGGRVNSLGYREYRDVLKWANLLHDQFGNEKIVIHGICIGSSTALFAATDEKCPDYIKGIVADGMYGRFFDSFRFHMKERTPVTFPFLWIVMLYIRIFSGADVVNDGPFKRIKKMKKPILFIHSLEDTYSLPEKLKELYADCPSENKKVVWFDHGAHSRVRLNSPDKYDCAIAEFLSTI